MTPPTDVLSPPVFAIDLPDPAPAASLKEPPAEALDSEWVLTNGLGGFAMGSASGVNTRRYHSLLTIAQHPPVQRLNLLNTVADSIAIGGVSFDLATFEFTGNEGPVFHPRGFAYLRRFEKEPGAARWIFEVGPLRVTRELKILWGADAAVLSYIIEPLAAPGSEQPPAPREVAIAVRPMVALRDFHHQRRGNHFDPFNIIAGPSQVIVGTESMPALHIRGEGWSFTEQRDGWFAFRRRRESDRQQDDVEDLYCPGHFEITCPPEDVAAGAEMRLTISAGPLEAPPEGEDARLALIHRVAEHLYEQVGSSSFVAAPTIAALAAAAIDFVVPRTVDGKPMMTILAGYPWFADWGRDTMISLPGLLLATGRHEEAKQTLVTYARHIRRGLVPNRFDDYGGEPHYNTVDASLWFIHAALEYLRITGDEATWRETLAEACRQIITAYEHGTEGPIRMDRDGLIMAGNIFTQLTWMDAARDGIVFTPRRGKAVEINALWHRALTGCAGVVSGYDRPAAEHWRKLAVKVQRAFTRTFWDDELGFLVDHVDGHLVDRSFRPNQVLAVSLPNSPLSEAKQKQVMQQVRERLLTPMGLRTLPIDDWNYHGNYSGSMFERDRAYHQGCVWPWLIGPYVEGWLRAHKFSQPARKHGREALRPLLDELGHHSLGQLHEIYSGAPPHAPHGCIAQAWSVAEVLRAVMMVES